MKLFNMFNKVIYENEDINDVHELVEAAVKEGADLFTAKLMGVYLIEANLEGANLLGAYLLRANLEGTCLLGACLRNARLDGANL